MPNIDLSRPCSISLRQQHPTADLAARELAGLITAISGQPADVSMYADGMSAQPAAGEIHFLLDFEPNGDDGFAWRVEGNTVHLHGNHPRGLLYAVYSFLEHLGCCWPAPDERYQMFPRGTRFEIPESVSEAPGLPGRCLIIGHQAFMQDVADWVIWAARNRLNTIFFHTTTGSLALGAVPESQYQALKPVFLPLMQERGMLLEHGGHGLTELLPRERFAELPDAFRMKDGARTPDHNFCPSSEEGLKIIRQNAEKHFRAHPEVDVFHLWGDDIPGGWCGCERCAPFSASEQLLMAVNELADVLARVNPAAQISLIAYHDTEAVPHQVKPKANVNVLWAPRMRCYGHPLTDDGCRLNQPKYTQTVRDQVGYFKSAGAAPMRVFEYYLDAVLFKSVMPPLPTVMQRDTQFYRQAGVHTLQALMTGDYPWTTPQLNVWLFPRLCWNPDADVDALIRQFGLNVYGIDLSAYYRALEQAFSLALAIEPEQMKIVVSHGIDSIWADPPADMGDPIFAPPAVLVQKLDKNADIQTWLERAESELDAAAPDGNALLQGERDHFRLLKGWLTFDYARLQLYAAIAAAVAAAEVSGSRQEIRVKWLQAHKALGEVYRWGKRFIASPQYRLNFEFIQFYTWHIRLNKIRAGYLSGPAGCRWVELAVKTKLAGYYARLRHLFDAPAKP